MVQDLLSEGLSVGESCSPDPGRLSETRGFGGVTWWGETNRMYPYEGRYLEHLTKPTYKFPYFIAFNFLISQVGSVDADLFHCSRSDSQEEGHT